MRNVNKRIVCIVQARMGSTRLPGKVLLPLAGKALLLCVIDRLLQATCLDEIVIATTTRENDDAIAGLVDGYHPKVSVYRGSEEDVLDRYYQAAKERDADIVVRATSDNPMLDPDIVDATVEILLADADIDYVSNSVGRRTFPRGLDMECMTFAALRRCWREGHDLMDREHVTVYIKRSPEKFKTQSYEQDADFSHLRWTVDEPDDYLLAGTIYDTLIPKDSCFRTKDILNLLKERPELIVINQHVEQKNPQY